jgi:hypothetical protein
MPNLNSEFGIPGFINAGDSSSHLMANRMNQPTSHFGQQSLANMHYNSNQGGVQMDNRGPPLVVSSVNASASELEQLRQQNTLQQQQLQRQQEILLRQQQLLQQQLQHTNQMMKSARMGQQYQGSGGNPYPYDQDGGLGGSELDNYLSNLDLSNM